MVGTFVRQASASSVVSEVAGGDIQGILATREAAQQVSQGDFGPSPHVQSLQYNSEHTR